MDKYEKIKELEKERDKKIDAAWEEFDRVEISYEQYERTTKLAYVEYDREVTALMDKDMRIKELRKKRDEKLKTALDEFNRVTAPALEECIRVTQPANEKYRQAIISPMRDRVHLENQAYEEFDREVAALNKEEK